MAGTLADQALRFTRRRSALRKGVSRGSGAGLKQPERRQVRTVTAANLRISAETAKRFALIITTLTFLAISKSPSPPCRGTYFRRRRNGLERGSERRCNGCFRPRRESQNNAWKLARQEIFLLPHFPPIWPPPMSVLGAGQHYISTISPAISKKI